MKIRPKNVAPRHMINKRDNAAYDHESVNVDSKIPHECNSITSYQAAK